MVCFGAIIMQIILLSETQIYVENNIRNLIAKNGEEKKYQNKQFKSQNTQNQRLPRPDIISENGLILAADIKIASLYAEPYKITDIDQTIEKLTPYLAYKNIPNLRKKLSLKRKFIWIEREITPSKQEKIHELGLPGIGFKSETRRVYPMKNLAAHILGFVDVDSRGLAGIEKYLDENGKIFVASLTEPYKNQVNPVTLTLNIGMQHILRQNLKNAMNEFSAKAAAGVILNVHTGEIKALVSLPDFDPNSPKQALNEDKINRITAGVFEMGSAVKTVTVAMALDENIITIENVYDATNPIRIAGFTIDDFHAQRRPLSVKEIFTYSSNIGTGKIALDVGLEKHKYFLKKIGFNQKLQTELPEAAKPLFPKRWTNIESVTASFGHGFSIQPLQLASVIAAFVNGGTLITPTFLPRDENIAQHIGKRIIKNKTAQIIKYLLEENVIQGTAKKAYKEGYHIGGKTGSAEKIIDGKYSSNHRMTSFVGAFPMKDPQYVILIMLDEPKPTPETTGYATAGWNAVPVAGDIIEQIAPIVKIKPDIEKKNMQNEEEDVKVVIKPYQKKMENPIKEAKINQINTQE